MRDMDPVTFAKEFVAKNKPCIILGERLDERERMESLHACMHHPS